MKFWLVDVRTSSVPVWHTMVYRASSTEALMEALEDYEKSYPDARPEDMRICVTQSTISQVGDRP